MNKVKMIILCAAGMSSGLIVNNIKKDAEKVGVEVDVSCSYSLRFREADYSDVDIVCFAPQVRTQKADVEQYLKEQGLNVSTYLIPPQDYGLARGEKILRAAIEEIETFKNK